METLKTIGKFESGVWSIREETGDRQTADKQYIIQCLRRIKNDLEKNIAQF